MGRVSVNAVSKVYDGDIVAVDEVSAEIRDGEFVTIVGPSGSGKSTLLRMIAGLEDITDGTVEIGGEAVNGVQPQDRGVAMVFQNYALYPHMTARKNMSYGLKLTTDLPQDEIDAKVEEAAEMMGIEKQLDKKPGSLSGGQQQRVATGRAIVRDPEVFLFDEPLSNLDAKLRLHMRTELQQLQDELGTTAIYVTHDQEEAMTMSDRIIVLNEGEIQQIGTPEEIYGEPANQFVADFVGSPSMNTFPVELRDDVLVGTAFEYTLPETYRERVSKRASDGEELVLGIRPEHVDVVETGGQNTIRASLDVREPVGSDNFLYLSVGDEECCVRVSGERQPEEGTTLTMRFDPSHLHLFERDSGRNLLYGAHDQTRASEAPQESMVSTEG
ncbi:ABC transporter ATP-binding protein [Haloarcula salina]|uniref:ABC transporter ATP-binding protein n=1 Tax=Haloarcula salina TaxID=1429914 RepID=UPI003C703B98